MEKITIKEFSRRVSWGSVFAGIVTVLAISILMAVLAASVGFFTIDPLADKSFSGVGTGIIIVTVISLIVSLCAGGFIAGKLAGTDGVIHGFLVWAGTMIITIVFTVWTMIGAVSLAGNALGAVGSMAGNVVSGVGSVASEGVSQLSGLAEDIFGDIDIDTDTQELQSNVLDAMRRSGVREFQPEYLKGQMNAVKKDLDRSVKKIVANPQQAESIANGFLDRVQSRVDGITSSINKDDVVRAISNNSNLSRAEAENTVDQYMALIEQGKDKLEELKVTLADAQKEWEKMKHQALIELDKASNAAGRATMWSFIGLLIGAAICSFAGLWGTSMTRKGYQI